MPYTTLPSVDELYKKNLEAYKPQQDEEIAEKNKIFDSRYQNTQNLYGKTIKDTDASYDEAQQKNELQKYINEKQLQENMANLGLTDSGLNRTQQTAVQLSYANNKADLNRQRQSAVDALTLEMNSALTTIDADRATAVTGVKDKYTSLATSNAQSTYSANLDYIQKEQEKAEKAEKEKNSLYVFTGTKKDELGNTIIGDTDKNGENGIMTIHFKNSLTGEIEDFQSYQNPYTGADNRLTYSDEFEDPDIGFFQLADGVPGYQPKGLVSEGGKFTALTAANGSYIKYDFKGKYQKIWIAPNKNADGSLRYFYWDGNQNQYIMLNNDFVEKIKKDFS